MKELKIEHAWLCIPKDGEIVPVFGNIHIENGIITKIEEVKEKTVGFSPVILSANVIEAGGRVVTLPNVNFHDHFYSRLAKGLDIKKSTADFPLILENLWWKLDTVLDEDMIAASAQMALLESIRNGVTYIFDHHSSPNTSRKILKQIATEITHFGLRGVVCFETTDRGGQELSKSGFEENVMFLEKHQSNKVKGIFGLHASFTLDDATLQKVADFVKTHDCGIHIHLCEDASDRTISMEKYGETPVKRLAKFGLLNRKSILAHCIHLDDEDRKIIADSGAAVVYNFDSNLNNQVGLPPLAKLPPSVPVLCGTDGMNAKPHSTFRNLFLFGRHQGMSFGDAIALVKKSYFDQITFARHYFHDFPTLQQGSRADLIVWDYIPPTPFDQNTFWGHYLYGVLERNIHTVIQNGNLLMDHSRIQFPQDIYFNSIAVQGARLKQSFEKES